MFRIIVVDDEETHGKALAKSLKIQGYVVDLVDSALRCIEKLRNRQFDLVITDYMMNDMNGLELLNVIREGFPETDVIIITGYGSVHGAVEAMRQGAVSYFIKGSDPDELLIDVRRLSEYRQERQRNRILQAEFSSEGFYLKTRSKKLSEVLDVAERAAASNANILLLGESGVGKEVFARMIHSLSMRREQIFLAVNCYTFSDTLIESELYGHEKGAFTGATEKRIGRFEASNGGTLFMDELGDVPLSTQVKLLRTLETKTIERIGSHQVIDTDFRLICATNKDLNEEIRYKRFREDLYYRVSTIAIEIPPLRDRREDIPSLINFFASRSAAEMKRPLIRIEQDVTERLKNYHFPGNVRELKNIIERLTVLSDGGVVHLRDLPYELTRGNIINPGNTEGYDLTQTYRDARESFEMEFLSRALSACNDNVSETARRYGISRRHLINLLNKKRDV